MGAFAQLLWRRIIILVTISVAAACALAGGRGCCVSPLLRRSLQVEAAWAAAGPRRGFVIEERPPSSSEGGHEEAEILPGGHDFEKVVIDGAVRLLPCLQCAIRMLRENVPNTVLQQVEEGSGGDVRAREEDGRRWRRRCYGGACAI